MRPNDETIVAGGTAKNEENPQVANANKKAIPWKMIGLGSATGILMGAGALYASSAMASGTSEIADSQANAEGAEGANSQEVKMPVAKVDSGDSFEHAFAEARDQVGPGGVFHWHGGIYNTYTKEEWDLMSDEDKREFAAKIQPEYGVERINAVSITENDPQIHIYTEKVVVHEPEVDPEPTNDEDVHYLGSEEITLDGKDITIQHFDARGHAAAVVDYHDENEHDIAWVDENDNQKLDHAEAVDMVTGEYLDANLNPIPGANIHTTGADEVDSSADFSVDI